MRSPLIAAFLLVAASVVPARAASVTIDSTNCSTPDACYGLAWTLTVLAGDFSYNGVDYDYQAILDVTDDVGGPASVTISAVDFKASNSVVQDGAVLYMAPTTLGAWTTQTNVLNSGGCEGPNAGFVCSQTLTAEVGGNPSTDPDQKWTWAWYFNSDTAIFTDLEGAHIGAKLTTIDPFRPGKLLSEEFHGTTVPEPGTLTLLGAALLGLVTFGRRQNA
jgi:hypothetical protein